MYSIYESKIPSIMTPPTHSPYLRRSERTLPCLDIFRDFFEEQPEPNRDEYEDNGNEDWVEDSVQYASESELSDIEISDEEEEEYIQISDEEEEE